jgi:hypothetical protein
LGAVCKSACRRVRFPCGPLWSGGPERLYGTRLLSGRRTDVRGFESRSLRSRMVDREGRVPGRKPGAAARVVRRFDPCTIRPTCRSERASPVRSYESREMPVIHVRPVGGRVRSSGSGPYRQVARRSRPDVPILPPQVAQMRRLARSYLQLLHIRCAQLVVKGDKQSEQIRASGTARRWLIRYVGEVAEWFKALVSKTSRCSSLVGSNPALAAIGASWQSGLLQPP